MITRSKGSQSEYESRELGEARWRGSKGRGGVMEKGRGDRESEAVCECAATKSRGPCERFAF